MDRRAVCQSLTALSALAIVPVRAQSGRQARVAWTSVDRANHDSPFLVSFRRALRDVGWLEGRNVAIDTFWGGGSVDGLKKIVPESVSYPDRFAAFAAKSRIPAFSSWADFAEKGNLMTYGPILQECYARLATFVDRILKGEKPADMPVERPTKFELVVNLKAAKAIGMSVPQSILLRADRVIE